VVGVLPDSMSVEGSQRGEIPPAGTTAIERDSVETRVSQSRYLLRLLR
jgi:hypothetical protein